MDAAKTATNAVRRAINETHMDRNLGRHWAGLLSSRAGNDEPTGSFVPGVNALELLERLLDANWEPYDHPAVQPPAKAFITRNISGQVGLVNLADLPPETPVRLADGHATGFLSAQVEGGKLQEAQFTVLLIGPRDDPDGPDIVWTFHPGDPIRPSSLTANGSVAAGSVISAADALALGFEIAKIT